MPAPGELSQEIGRAYLYVLSGCLNATVSGFTPEFNVLQHPEKLTFLAPNSRSYSFDALGRLNQPPFDCEVLFESKGYKNGNALIKQYRAFVVKAYVTSLTIERHKNDLFWFVTNVPFGTAVGRELTDDKWVARCLAESGRSGVQELLGSSTVDPDHVRKLASQLAVCILTDSFMRHTRIGYRVQRGDTVWDVAKLLHAGRVPTEYYGGQFEPFARHVARESELTDPNSIEPGQMLRVPWYGFDA